mmetsp:Transcript_18632/g.47110  ORF Transcript_18632/g.47110 Transcript_18632/m.47110 type:complete len:109 (-) Transcript_18632:696-1022(-)
MSEQQQGASLDATQYSRHGCSRNSYTSCSKSLGFCPLFGLFPAASPLLFGFFLAPPPPRCLVFQQPAGLRNLVRKSLPMPPPLFGPPQLLELPAERLQLLNPRGFPPA